MLSRLFTSRTRDPEMGRQGRLLMIMVVAVLLVAIPSVPLNIWLGAPLRAGTLVGGLIVLLGAYALAYNGRVRPAVWLVILVIFGLTNLFDLGPSSQIQGLLDPFYLVGAIGIAGVFLPVRQVLAVMFLCVANALELYLFGIPVLASIRASQPEILAYTIAVDLTVYLVNGTLFSLGSVLIRQGLKDEQQHKQELSVLAARQQQASTQVQSALGRLAGNLAQISAHQTASVTTQSSAIQEVAGAAAELHASAVQISTQARTIQESMARLIAQIAERTLLENQGQQVVTRTATQLDLLIGRVEELRGAFQRVTAFVDVISTLADETHLLALNATLEAVGAGEHGRRFGVVASSVRDLANEATQATETIRRILGTIAVADQSTAEAAAASRDLPGLIAHNIAQGREIQEAASQTTTVVNGLTGQIVAASLQQVASMAQIERTMQEIVAQTQRVVEEAFQVEHVAGDLHRAETTLSQAVGSLAPATRTALSEMKVL